VFNYCDSTMPEFHDYVSDRPILNFLNTLFRGYGQCILCNNPISGVLFLLGQLLSSTGPWVGIVGFGGLLAATTLALLLKINKDTVRGGIYGYNGVFLGSSCATLLFRKWDAFVIIVVLIFSMSTTLLQVALGNMIIPTWGLPPGSWPNNIVMVFVCACGPYLRNLHVNAAVTPLPPASNSTYFELDIDPAQIGIAFTNNIADLMFSEGYTSTILFLCGMAVCSRILAGMCLVGCVWAIILQYAGGLAAVSIYSGTWGSNTIFSVICVGGFFLCTQLALVFAGTVQWCFHTGAHSWHEKFFESKRNKHLFYSCFNYHFDIRVTTGGAAWNYTGRVGHLDDTRVPYTEVETRQIFDSQNEYIQTGRKIIRQEKNINICLYPSCMLENKPPKFGDHKT